MMLQGECKAHHRSSNKLRDTSEDTKSKSDSQSVDRKKIEKSKSVRRTKREESKKKEDGVRIQVKCDESESIKKGKKIDLLETKPKQLKHKRGKSDCGKVEKMLAKEKKEMSKDQTKVCDQSIPRYCIS